MKSNTRIYRLGKNHSDVFQRFDALPGNVMSLTGQVTEDGEELKRTFDFARFRVSKQNFTIPSLRRKWDVPEMSGQNQVAPFNDFPCCGYFIPVFSENAVCVLEEFLVANGELLPVSTKRGSYFAYQTRTIVDGIVNIKKCKDLGCEFREGINVYDDIGSLSFYSSKIAKDLSIFRLREFPSEPFVGQTFVQRAMSNGLQGFGFTQVYPKLTLAQRRSETSKFDAKVQLDGKEVDPQKETMKIEFVLEGNRPSKNEQKAFEAIVGKLKKLLVLTDPKDNFFGAVQSAFAEKRKAAIYVSTPSAERLEEHLAEFLATASWPIPPNVKTKKKTFWQSYRAVFS